MTSEVFHATIITLILSGLKNAMNKTAFLILVAATISCKKGSKDYNNLASKWEIRQAVGGLMGTINYQPGNGNILEFKSDNSFASYVKDSIVWSGSYNLKSTSEKDQYRVTFHSNMGDQSRNISLKNDTLVLLAPEACCDMPTDTYVRINSVTEY